MSRLFMIICTLVIVSLLIAMPSMMYAQSDEQESIATNDSTLENGQSAKPQQQYAENYVFANPTQRKAFLELTAELRCPKCQNQNIADSDAPIAHDMRRKVYQLMQEGNDKPQVIDWMKQRYGDFVHYQPPVNAVTIWLWLLPLLFAIIMAVFFIRRRKPEYDQNIEAKLAQAEQMLKGD